jgi:hypothetical protein
MNVKERVGGRQRERESERRKQWMVNLIKVHYMHVTMKSHIKTSLYNE